MKGYTGAGDSGRSGTRTRRNIPKDSPVFELMGTLEAVSYTHLKKIEGKLNPSSEIKMHLRVYRDRPDVNAVVHAHPPTATAFAVANIPLDKYILPEAILTVGTVPICEYGTPSTMAVSYTHLDVYKRQNPTCSKRIISGVLLFQHQLQRHIKHLNDDGIDGGGAEDNAHKDAQRRGDNVGAGVEKQIHHPNEGKTAGQGGKEGGHHRLKRKALSG